MLRWMLIDLNSYFASCEQQLDAELRGRPIAVVPLLSESTSCLAASIEAKLFGIKTGTNVGEAMKLCPDLILVEADHKKYVQIHEQIVEAVESCVPVHKVLSIDEMICELTGTQREESQARALAHRVKQTIKDRVGICLRSSIGIAPNRLLAKLGSDWEKPDGLVVFRKAELPQAIFKCRLRDLYGIGEKMEARLNRFGISTIEKLASLSRPEMVRVWGGILGERYYRWIRGEENFEPATQTRSLSHQHVLAPELRSKVEAQKIMMQLLDKVAIRLRRDGYFARRLAFEVKWVGREGNEIPNWETYARFDETQETRVLIHSAQELLRGWPENHFQKPLRVSVVLSDLVPADRHQLGLFTDPRSGKLSQTMDTINDRFGKHAVYFGAIAESKDQADTKIAFSRIPKKEEF